MKMTETSVSKLFFCYPQALLKLEVASTHFSSALLWVPNKYIKPSLFPNSLLLTPHNAHRFTKLFHYTSIH